MGLLSAVFGVALGLASFDFAPVLLRLEVEDRISGRRYHVDAATQQGRLDIARRVEGGTEMVLLVDRETITGRFWDSGEPGFYPDYHPWGGGPEMAPLTPLYHRSILARLQRRVAAGEDGVTGWVRDEDGGRVAVFQIEPGEHPYSRMVRARLDDQGRPLSVEQWFEWPGEPPVLGMEDRIGGYLAQLPDIPASIEFLHYFPLGSEEPKYHFDIQVVDAQHLDPSGMPALLARWTNGLEERAPGRRATLDGGPGSRFQAADVAMGRANRTARWAWWLVPAGVIALAGAVLLRLRR